MEVGFYTDRGRIRDINEDACGILRNERIFIVADGVGGNRSGEIASRGAVEGIADYVEEHPVSGVETRDDVKQYFNDCFRLINNRIYTLAQQDISKRGMATTLVAAYQVHNILYVMNIGDSRAYVFRKGKMQQITDDHTYVNTLLEAGVITEEEAEVHENRNMITRAIGAASSVNVDYFEVALKPEDIVLMCSDGLTNMIEDKDILEIVRTEGDLKTKADLLIKTANENGGKDNIAVLLMQPDRKTGKEGKIADTLRIRKKE